MVIFPVRSSHKRNLRKRFWFVMIAVVTLIGIGLPAAQAASKTATLSVELIDGVVVVNGKAFPVSAPVQVVATIANGFGQSTVTSDATGSFLLGFSPPGGFNGQVSVSAISDAAQASGQTNIASATAPPLAAEPSAQPVAASQAPSLPIPPSPAGAAGASPYNALLARMRQTQYDMTNNFCAYSPFNIEPESIVGYSPAPGQSVGAGGQIKVWISDENAPFVAPGEQINRQTGQIIAPGNRAAKANDGYLLEPALYIGPQTAEKGGPPHFPIAIKGNVNTNPPNQSSMMPLDFIRARSNPGTFIAGVEPVPPGTTTAAAAQSLAYGSHSPPSHMWKSEYVWDVDSLQLAPGTYMAEFLIMDGDYDRGAGCANITIGTAAPAPAPVAAPTSRRS